MSVTRYCWDKDMQGKVFMAENAYGEYVKLSDYAALQQKLEATEVSLSEMTQIRDMFANSKDQVEKQRYEDAKLLNWLEEESYDLRCQEWPTGGDDADIGWVVISHHRAEPKEREEGVGTTPRDAIRDAMKEKNDPTRWGYFPDPSESAIQSIEGGK